MSLWKSCHAVYLLIVGILLLPVISGLKAVLIRNSSREPKRGSSRLLYDNDFGSEQTNGR